MNIFYFTITFALSTILIIRIMSTMSTSFSAYRRNRYQNQIAVNNQQVIKDAQSKEKSLIKKIESFIKEKLTDTERCGITVDTVCERITAGDALVCAMFRKDPTKQSLDETTQIQWLKENLSPTVCKLPADGNGAKFFLDGSLRIISAQHPRPNNATKTLDTFDPATNTYGVLKHTSIAGGSQDNQLRDVKDFVREMVKYLDQTPTAAETFVLYLDGPYYTEDRLRGIRLLIPDSWTESQTSKIRITNCEAITPADP